MNIPRALRTPSLAWRTWALLTFTALLPMVAIAWLSASQTEALLIDQSRARTADAAKRHAASTQGRLDDAAATLRELAQQLEWSRAASLVLTERARRTFASVVVLRVDGTLRALHGARPGMPEIPRTARFHLDAGASLLLVLPQLGQPGRVFLLRALSGAHPTGTLLAAELEPGYLWDTWPATVPALERCVLSAGTDAVSCLSGAPQAQVLQQAFAQGASGPLEWRRGGERFLASYHELPLAQAYHAAAWMFLAAEPRRQALAPAAALWRMLALALIASAMLATLLGVLHVRAAQRSARVLTEATRRVAEARLDGELELPPDPELEQVSAALRGMAIALRLERTVQRALADIDQQFLECAGLDAVSRGVVSCLRGIVAAQAVALVLKSQSNAQSARLYATGDEDAGDVQETSVPYVPLVGEQRLIGSDGIWLRAPLPADPVLSALARQGAQHVLVVPVTWSRSLVGMLVLGFAREDALPVQAQEPLRQFAARVAMAFAAAAREQQLYYQSHFDALTGLPNRRSFMERLGHERERAQRDGSMLAVILVNLDQFKSVNDMLGHAGGDDVIRHAAARIKQCARSADTVARIGGDEFALLLPRLPAATEVARMAAQLMRSLAAPLLSGEHERVLSASVGVALYPTDAQSAEALVRNADTAMHRAKESGGGRVTYFEERMNQEVNRRVTLERELRRALDRDEFVLYYQPQMDARSGVLTGAEVLIRWQHPERGLQAPAAFIDIAEQTGLIEPIGELVLRKACLQLQAWQSAHTAPPRLSVNVSGRQFRRRDFAALVASILRETGVDASRLELEITETLLMEDADASGVVLNQLGALGVRLAIDDFGTGYSSLAYLKRLRFDALKIDRSFVKDVTTDEDSAAIASAIIALARTLRKQTVAEGVETQEQLDFLRKEQCDLIQGFLISRPVPAEKFVVALGSTISRTRSALRLAASR